VTVLVLLKLVVHEVLELVAVVTVLVLLCLVVHEVDEEDGAEQCGLHLYGEVEREGDSEVVCVRKHLLAESGPLLADHTNLSVGLRHAHHLELNVRTAAAGPAGSLDPQHRLSARILDDESWVEDGPLLLHGADDGARGRLHLKCLEAAGKAAGLTGQGPL